MNILIISISAIIIIIVIIIIVVVMNSSDDNTVNSSSNLLYCQEVNSSTTSLAWPRTNSGITAYQECPTGFYGEISRACNNGTWGDEDRTKCKEIQDCPADGDWPKTAGKTFASIGCPTDYVGSHRRFCYEDGTWGDEEIKCIQLANINNSETCGIIPVDISSNQVLIILKIPLFGDIDDNGELKTVDFTFSANIDSIAKDYDNIKDTIPAKLKSQTGEDRTYTYPDKLQVFKNDEYLIVVSKHMTKIITYSYDYPYNYINNSLVTIQSKTFQTIEPRKNLLYKMWAYIPKYDTEDDCKNSVASMRNIKIGYLYTNNYINLCLIISAMCTSDNDVTISSLGDCTVTFESYKGKTLFLMLSTDKLCSGVYTFADIKNNFTNFCKTYNLANGKGWKYTIDLNKPYNPTPTVYSLSESKDITIFDTGSNMFKSNYDGSSEIADWIPQILCNHIDLQ